MRRPLERLTFLNTLEETFTSGIGSSLSPTSARKNGQHTVHLPVGIPTLQQILDETATLSHSPIDNELLPIACRQADHHM